MMDTTLRIRKTEQAYLWTSALKAPFWAIYCLLIFILCKDLHATSFQIAVFIALKPVVSIFSIYWSNWVHQRPDRLRTNLIAAGCLSYLPFFFFPVINSPWFVIGAAALYMMLKRGIIPAWMEILKLNLPEEKRKKIVSSGNSISYITGALLPLAFAPLMDVQPGIWRLFFPFAALLSLAGVYFQWRIPIDAAMIEKVKKPLNHHLLKPWKEAWALCRSRKDFMTFQLGFMLGGGGLMVMQPAIPIFFVDSLHLSYTALAIAIAFCKGVGFAITSRIWTRFMDKVNIYRLCGIVTIFAALFPVFLLFGIQSLTWVFVAYLLYGVMQAGSELTWHMSGPIFAKEEDSTPYSSVSVMAVGIRGLFAPFLGSILCSSLGSSSALLIGGGLCIMATLYLTQKQNAFTSETT